MVERIACMDGGGGKHPRSLAFPGNYQGAGSSPASGSHQGIGPLHVGTQHMFSLSIGLDTIAVIPGRLRALGV